VRHIVNNTTYTVGLQIISTVLNAIKNLKRQNSTFLTQVLMQVRLPTSVKVRAIMFNSLESLIANSDPVIALIDACEGCFKLTAHVFGTELPCTNSSAFFCFQMALSFDLYCMTVNHMQH
jgi:hypothetical protein